MDVKLKWRCSHLTPLMLNHTVGALSTKDVIQKGRPHILASWVG